MKYAAHDDSGKIHYAYSSVVELPQSSAPEGLRLLLVDDWFSGEHINQYRVENGALVLIE